MTNNNNFFNDYGYIPQDAWEGRETQLKEQGMNTDFYLEYGRGYYPCVTSGAGVQSDWNETNTESLSYIKNKPIIGDGTITIKQGDMTKGVFTMNQSDSLTITLGDSLSSVGWSDIADKPSFATVATTGDYADLTNKPTMSESIIHDVELDYNGYVVQGSYTIDYDDVYANLSDETKTDVLRVKWEHSQGSSTYTTIYAPVLGKSGINNNDYIIFGQYAFHNGEQRYTAFLLTKSGNSSVLICSPLPTWELTSRKVQSVVANKLSETNYPSTKAVFDEFQRKPVVIWEETTPANYLAAIQADLSASPNWQLTNLDMTPFKRIKIYTCAGRKSSGVGVDASTTPAIILEMSLDSRAAIASYGNNFVASIIVQKPNDANRFASLTCAVS